MKKIKWIFLVVSIAINIFIMVNACLNGNVSSSESNGFSGFIANILNFVVPNCINESNFSNFAAIIRKLFGHFGVFVLDGIFSTLTIFAFCNETKIKSAIYLSIFSLSFGFLMSLISEIIQIFTPGRFGSWLDILIDFGGFILGFLIILLILFLKKQIYFKKQQNNANLQ